MSDCTTSAEDCANAAPNCSIVAENCVETADSCVVIAETGEKQRAPFRWTKTAEKAAAMVADDEIPDAAIARACLIAPRTLSYWKVNPEFAARVRSHKALTTKDAMDFSIARKIERVRALDARWAKMHQVIEARAADMPEVPGGPSGLLVRKIKSIGAGLTAREVEEYEVDTGLLKELREHERQAAIEVGQWQEGQALKPGEARLTVTYDAIQAIQQSDPDRWRRIEAAAQAIMAEERGLPAARLVVDAGTEGGSK